MSTEFEDLCSCFPALPGEFAEQAIGGCRRFDHDRAHPRLSQPGTFGSEAGMFESVSAIEVPINPQTSVG